MSPLQLCKLDALMPLVRQEHPVFFYYEMVGLADLDFRRSSTPTPYQIRMLNEAYTRLKGTAPCKTPGETKHNPSPPPNQE